MRIDRNLGQSPFYFRYVYVYTANPPKGYKDIEAIATISKEMIGGG